MKNNEGVRITLKNISLGYNLATIVENFSLHVNKSELLTILGPSGCGKTTVLKSIAGFLYPSTGKIFIDDTDITEIPPYQRNIGMVFQNLALFPHMTVFENVAFSLCQRNYDKAEINSKVSSILELVNLINYERRYPSQLSGGEQQRLALARTLVFNPPLLLFDEPLCRLDKKLKDVLILEIKRLHNELKTTVIYVTHDQIEAMMISDRIAVMNKGKIEQIGLVEDIYENPNNRFIAKFIGETNLFEGKVISIYRETLLIDLGDLKIPVLLKYSQSKNLKINDNVSTFIRPEKVFFIEKGNSRQKGYNGKIISSSFLGEYIKYLIQIGSGLIVKLSQPANDFHHYTKGALVKIGWQAEDIKIISDDARA